MLEGSILQKLRDAHQSGQVGKRPLNFGVYYKNTLVALCHALEDSILTADYSPLMITAFQRGKWYLEEADRYGEIAARSRQIVIMAAPDAGFAEHPTSQQPNVALVSLPPTDPVSQEWHLIILSPRYTAMVLCQELSEADYGAAGLPQQDRERKFYGLWTFEPSLVQETAELAIAHISSYDPQLQAVLTAQAQEISGLSQSERALYGSPTADNLGEIVSRVIDYLQVSHATVNQAGQSYATQPHNLDTNLISNELQALLRISQLIDQTDLSNPMAAVEVATLAETLGQLLDLPAWQLHRLRLAGLLHRIAFLQTLKTELSPGASSRYKEDAPDAPLACPLVPGTQVLRTMQRLRAIATILTHQTEWWNGTGLPAGLAGDDIPVESRILGLAAAFQQQLANLRTSPNHLEDSIPDSEDHLTQALTDCQAQQGDRWDPKLIEVLELLVNGFKQGLSLPVALPKIASGLWLLDSHSDEELLSFFEGDSPNPASTPIGHGTHGH